MMLIIIKTLPAMIHFDYGHPGYFRGLHWLGWLFFIFVLFVCLVYFLIFLWVWIGYGREKWKEDLRKAGYDKKKLCPGGDGSYYLLLLIFFFRSLVFSIKFSFINRCPSFFLK